MSTAASTSSGGVGITGLLTVAFVVLKLCNVINWPWWSWNGFELSVFLFVTWGLYLVGGLILGVIAYALYEAVRKSRK